MIKYFRLLALIALIVSLVACTSAPTSAPTTTPEPSPTPTLMATARPTETPTPTAKLTYTPTPTATLTYTPTPVPWTLAEAVSKLPEFYTGALPQETIDEYTQLISALPEEAQWWITNMGWGIEDLVLDKNEIILLEYLATTNVPTALSILTRPDIIDGVTLGEVSWVRDYHVENTTASLQDDIDELLSQGLLSDKGLQGINLLLEMSSSDFEIIKSFFLVDNYGYPNSNMFLYPTPQYNTQLYFLGQLTELGVPEGYEVTALAAALCYGSLWTIADDEVRTYLPQYVHSMILFLAETDYFIQQNDASWQAKDFPLEAQIALVWGAPGNYYPLTKEEATNLGRQNEPFASWSGYREVFSRRTMSYEDFNFVFIELSSLKEMREYLLEQDILGPDPDILSGYIFDEYMHNRLDYQWEPVYQDIDGWKIYNSYICNIDWQWHRLNTGGKAIGGSGDAYIHTFLIKSLNLPGITPTFVVHQSGYYDHRGEIWTASTKEIRIEKNDPRKIDTRLGWNKIPYDNFWLPTIRGNWSGRQRILMPSNPALVWGSGLPKGYIFRADLSPEPSPSLP